MQTGEIWWNALPNNIAVREKISTAFIDEKSVCLLVGEGKMAWRDIFLSLLEGSARSISGERAFKLCEPRRGADPGEFLMEKFCTETDRAKYWFTQDSADFLAGLPTTVLHQRFVYVAGLTGTDCEKWVDFVNRYTEKCAQRDHAVFVLECCKAHMQEKNGPEYINYTKNTTDQDCFMLCLTAASTLECEGIAKSYIAQLAANIAGSDIELAGELAMNGADLAVKPYNTAHRLISDSDGTLTDRVEKAVWDAQLKHLFPLLERFRSAFIKKYEQHLSRFLPIRNSFGSLVADAKDLELGAIHFLSNKIAISYEDKLLVDRCHDARNLLAHIKTVNYDELLQLTKIIQGI